LKRLHSFILFERSAESVYLILYFTGMTIFPNAKINIGLRISSRRDDGYHNIETIFYPLALRDALEFVTDDSGNDSDSLTVTGFNTSCPMHENLVIKAINLLRTSYNIPALRVHLHKAIPPGAGLGGGSSDAACILKYLVRYFSLGLCHEDMRKMVIKLGSDCPFFIDNQPSFATGRGEILTAVKPLPEGLHILLVNPGIIVNTGEAYKMSKPNKEDSLLPEKYAQGPAEWKGSITNDFEPAIFKLHPDISEIKDRLYEMGAVYASMSGSGSTVYGIFNYPPPASNFNDGYFTWSGVL
jgi:4-diphosphocytidyl-2-C-methyl-D-erythritol kinase